MSRVIWKGPYLNRLLIKKVSKEKVNVKKEIQTMSRDSTIIPLFIGKTFSIHNGKTFLKINITHDMIGYKLGEFAPTRKQFTFKKKKEKRN
jgi:small subunit ribosomal protein S19